MEKTATLIIAGSYVLLVDLAKNRDLAETPIHTTGLRRWAESWCRKHDYQLDASILK